MENGLRWNGAWLYFLLMSCGVVEATPSYVVANETAATPEAQDATEWSDAQVAPSADLQPSANAGVPEAGEAAAADDLPSTAESSSTAVGAETMSCDPYAFSHVAVSQGITCALRRDSGEAVCWGSGRMHTPVGVAFSSLEVGTGHACGIRKQDGQAQCWGSNAFGEATPPRGVCFSSLALGDDHSCGVTAAGEALCWGANGTGQTDVPSGMTFISLSAGRFHTCGVSSDQRVHCWGANGGAYTSRPDDLPLDMVWGDWEMGEGCARRTDTHQQICWGIVYRGERDAPSDLRFVSVSAGPQHACAIRADNRRVACWGALPPSPTPPPDDIAFSSLSDARCGLVDDTGEINCFLNSPLHSLMPPELRFSQFSTDYDHLCGITRDAGELRCFGLYNYFGEVAVPDGTAFEKFAIGSCGIRADDHTLQCWQGDTRVPEGIPFVSAKLYGGGCGVRRDGAEFYCWGDQSPLQVEMPAGVDPASVTFNSGSACGIVTDTQRAVCWGRNWWGEATPPADVPFTKLSMEGGTTCGLRADKATIQCWGNGFGFPSGAPGDTVFRDVYVGGWTGCGLRADTHEAECWVYFDDDLPNTQTPPGVAFSKLAITSRGVCGLRRSDRKVQCWGELKSYPWPQDEFIDLTPGGGPAHVCGLRASDRVEVCWGDITRGWNPPPRP